MVCMFGREMNDMLFNFTWGFYSGVGDWGVEGDDNDRGHAHPEASKGMTTIGAMPTRNLKRSSGWA